MRFDPELAEIRFGCGLSPRLPRPSSVEAMLDGLKAPDDVAARHPIDSYGDFRSHLMQRDRQAQARRKARGTPDYDRLRDEIRAHNREMQALQTRWLSANILRRASTNVPLRERLESFWADHFTVQGKGGAWRYAVSPFVESAVRPHLAGRFEDLLISAVTHPLMIHYLDQTRSIGPNSVRGRQIDNAGLNENLAREVLELHTLGAGGPYTQDDVRQLAELFTGMVLRDGQRVFRRALSELGTETVLGVTYSGDRSRFGDIEQVLRDLARHPATAAHLARKLAVHFVADSPDPDLVDAVRRALLDSGCDLMAGYRALLTHPAAWSPAPGNVKQPLDFVASAARALAVPETRLYALKPRPFLDLIGSPMAMMGHVWQQPSGPDGLEEDDHAWITPQGLAARLQWAVSAPRHLTEALPDPRDFVDTALGGRASDVVRFAAAAAESRTDGIGLVLASPAFQRM